MIINTRVLFAKTTGVQRYLQEILKRLQVDQKQTIASTKFKSGFGGHLWEQMFLPTQVGRNNLLWSPANTGPLSVTKQVVTIHDLAVLDIPDSFNRLFSSWYQLIIPRLVHKVQKVITVSSFTKKRIIETCEIDPEKIVVIINGVDDSFKPENPNKIEDIRRKLGTPSPDYILSIGSLEPRKNLGRLFSAWSLVQADLPNDLWLVVAGTKGKSLVFQDVSFDILPPRIYLTGYVPNEYLPALYSGAKAFVYPSLYEGFGLPPLEAMACGTPVIASNTTSLPEVVGDAGILVDPLNVEQIANAIQVVVTDDKLRGTLIERGLERAKLFSWDDTASLTWKVLQETAERTL